MLIDTELQGEENFLLNIATERPRQYCTVQYVCTMQYISASEICKKNKFAIRSQNVIFDHVFSGDATEDNLFSLKQCQIFAIVRAGTLL